VLKRSLGSFVTTPAGKLGQPKCANVVAKEEPVFGTCSQKIGTRLLPARVLFLVVPEDEVVDAVAFASAVLLGASA
jgi:hypothetical protein